MSIYEELDYAKFLYLFADDLWESCSAHKKSRDRAFATWTGEQRDRADIFAETLDEDAADRVEDLRNTSKWWVSQWMEVVDQHNDRVYETQKTYVQRYQDDMKEYSKPSSLGDRVVLGIADGVESVTNYRQDNPEDIVPRPKSMKDDPALWPQAPHFSIDNVFVHYRWAGHHADTLDGMPVPIIRLSYKNVPDNSLDHMGA